MTHTTDRELLELAAKAAGIAVVWREWATGRTDAFGCIKHTKKAGFRIDGRSLDPLADDGDALRLAVKLGLVIDTDYNDGAAVGSAYLSMDQFHEYDHPLRFGADRAAATRRAIVLAAAEIGKAGGAV